MLPLLIAATVQFSPLELHEALWGDAEIAPRQFEEARAFYASPAMQNRPVAHDYSCPLEKAAIKAAGALRLVVTDGTIWLLKPELKAKNNGKLVYELTTSDKSILEGDAQRYEVAAKVYEVDCGS